LHNTCTGTSTGAHTGFSVFLITVLFHTFMEVPSLRCRKISMNGSDDPNQSFLSREAHRNATRTKSALPFTSLARMVMLPGAMPPAVPEARTSGAVCVLPRPPITRPSVVSSSPM